MIEFLPRDAVLAWYMPSSYVCVSVRMCVHHTPIVSKQLNVGSSKQRQVTAMGL